MKCPAHPVAQLIILVAHAAHREQAVGAIPRVSIHAVTRQVALRIINIPRIRDLVGGVVGRGGAARAKIVLI